jgi:hypothetical protein
VKIGRSLLIEIGERRIEAAQALEAGAAGDLANR